MMSDLISRQAAIDEAKRLMRPDDDGTSINDTVRNMIRILQDLPSTQRRTNRDLIEREVVRDVIYSNQEPLNEYQLNKIPAVDDNADIVRCKDCDMWNVNDGSVYTHLCSVWSDYEDARIQCTEPNDFCSYAERREESE